VEYTKLIEKTENSRVAKINGIFEVVEILQGYGSQGARIQRENGEIMTIAGDAYFNTVNMHNEKMAYRAAHPIQLRTGRPEPVMVHCSCGHTVNSFSVMSASMGTSCPDCYDRMSE
jgi:hypothetical protein